MSDCPVNRTVHGNPCDGPGTYYCDSEVWSSECRRYFEQRKAEPGDLQQQAANIANGWWDTHGVVVRASSPHPLDQLAHHIAAALAAAEQRGARRVAERIEKLADWFDGGGDGVPRHRGRGATSNAYAAIRIRGALGDEQA